MEFENEVRLLGSPGARVVVGSRGWPLLGAALLGFGAGLALGLLAASRWRRWARWRRRHPRWRDMTAAPMRLPGENPDVETEL